jgi:hypothetical protein
MVNKLSPRKTLEKMAEKVKGQGIKKEDNLNKITRVVKKSLRNVRRS